MSTDRRDEPFLARWSRLKRSEGSGDGEPAAPQAGPEPSADTPASTADGRQSPQAQGATASTGETAEGGALEERLAAVDIDALDYDSDFAQFMQDGVPEELRTKALRKLWTTDPVFGIIDGLDDYCEDFSDTAWVTPELKTAYRVGRGFLSDEEVAAWERLDQPEASDAVAAAAGERQPDGRADATSAGGDAGEPTKAAGIEAANAEGAQTAAATQEPEAEQSSQPADDADPTPPDTKA